MTIQPVGGAEFAYTNLSGRTPGVAFTLASRVLPGIARVQAQVVPYALAWQEENRRALDGDGPLWVALGDSLTQGIGAGGHDRGWVGQLRTRLTRQGRRYRVVNLAFSGATTDDVLDRQLPALETLGEQPALVTLMIGSNDLMRPSRRSTMPDRFEQILHRLPPGSVVSTMPNPSRVAQRANAALARIAPDRGLVIAELRDRRTASWRGKLADDHFHPNERGYAAIADVLADAVLASGGEDPDAPR